MALPTKWFLKNSLDRSPARAGRYLPPPSLLIKMSYSNPAEHITRPASKDEIKDGITELTVAIKRFKDVVPEIRQGLGIKKIPNKFRDAKWLMQD